MPILNYTTSIKAHKTVAEIQELLAKKGARRITTDYEPDGLVSGISFMTMVNNVEIHFRLPARWKGVQSVLKKQTKAKKYHTGMG